VGSGQFTTNEIEHYSRDGVIVVKMWGTATTARLNRVCHEIYQGRPKNNALTRYRYDSRLLSIDLDDEYDAVLFDALFENGIAQFMWEQFSAILYGIEAGISLPPGYVTFWHTDKHVRLVHRVLYFPSFDERPAPRLNVMLGHIKPLWVSTSRLLSNRYTLAVEKAVAKRQTLWSSNDDLVLLNTECVHRAEPVARLPGAFRLLYSFTKIFTDREEAKPRPRIRLLGRSEEIQDLHLNDLVMRQYIRRLQQ
jgi:hypothetical protein